MDTTHKAHKVIRDTELSLRELMQQAIDKQQYSEVAEIARLTDAVSKILAQPSNAMTEKQSVVASHKPQSSKSSRKSPKKSQENKKDSYPKFIRDSQRLIKVGWSKKNRKEYEHRVPFSCAMLVARYLAESIEPGKLFQADEIFPITDGEENEIPSYQVYVTLAWLISSNCVEKRGRDGYIVIPGKLNIELINDLWAALPSS